MNERKDDDPMRLRGFRILTLGSILCASAMQVGCNVPVDVEDDEHPADAVDQQQLPLLVDEANDGDGADRSKNDGARLTALAGSCYADFICLYDTAQSASWMIAAPEYNQAYYCVVLTGSENNRTSYIKNQTDAKWRVYDSNNCTGSWGPIYPRTAGGMNSTWNNKIGSMMREAIP